MVLIAVLLPCLNNGRVSLHFVVFQVFPVLPKEKDYVAAGGQVGVLGNFRVG